MIFPSSRKSFPILPHMLFNSSQFSSILTNSPQYSQILNPFIPNPFQSTPILPYPPQSFSFLPNLLWYFTILSNLSQSSCNPPQSFQIFHILFQSSCNPPQSFQIFHILFQSRIPPNPSINPFRSSQVFFFQASQILPYLFQSYPINLNLLQFFSIIPNPVQYLQLFQSYPISLNLLQSLFNNPKSCSVSPAFFNPPQFFQSFLVLSNLSLS